MSFPGHVEHGVVVFDDGCSLPEGTKVRVEPLGAAALLRADAWQAALQAARELKDYDFDAWRRQREYDLQHARDHLP